MRDGEGSFKAAMAILIVLGGLMFYRMHHPAATFAADGIDADWDYVAQRSHDAHQPSIVLFTADWCPYCRMLRADVLSRSDVQREMGHYSFYVVNMTHPSATDEAHARKCHIDGFPTLIRFDANGKETDRANSLDASAMIPWLKAGE